MIVEDNVKEIDIQPFANAILNNKAHPNLYAAFGSAPKDEVETKIIASNSDLEMALQKGKCAYAAYIHHVGNLWIRVMYAIDSEDRQGLIGAWNPRYGSKRLLMENF
ncbi:MAG: hypothetical protein KZQ81_14045 [Candidatus Thiodiazotropha sp. (ex Rostrolucina anterorostrata)]|nr:hypothetical protein [Candidatus Thiodiazotropha sp. (ex Rostrolucina anterorostrata)]